MARECRDQAWQQYEEVFRQQMVVNPDLAWGQLDLKLWMMATTPMEDEDLAADGGSSCGSRSSRGVRP